MKTLIEKLKALRLYFVSKRYSEKEVDDLLTRQREICCNKMDDWCEYNNLKKCGHIVLYAPRP
jgi:hypothetical protein